MCIGGFYDQDLTSACQTCNPSCLECNGPANNNCTLCNNALGRTFNPLTSSCDCADYKYDAGDGTC